MKINLPITKKQGIRILWFASVLTVLLVSLLILRAVRSGIENSISEQTAAEEYGNTVPYALMDLILTDQNAFSPNNVPYLQSQIDNRLAMEAMKAENENAVLWFDVYSTETSLSLTSSQAGATGLATVFGGNYFMLHRPKLLSGSYLLDNADSLGFVVLDELLAWQLFGSTDIVGMSVTINDFPYTVCGVVAREAEDKLWLTSYSASPRLYILYDSAALLSGNLPVTCYELMLPNPVTDFAYNIAKDVLSSYTKEGELIDHASLFSAKNLAKRLGNSTYLAMHTKAIVYPAHENVATVLVSRAARVFLFEIILFALIVLELLVIFIRIWKPFMDKCTAFIHKIKDKLSYY